MLDSIYLEKNELIHSTKGKKYFMSFEKMIYEMLTRSLSGNIFWVLFGL